MEYKIKVTVHRRDYLERLPDKTLEYNLIASDVLEAEDWTKEKEEEIEYSDIHCEFCTSSIEPVKV